jgi:hypothetical protein
MVQTDDYKIELVKKMAGAWQMAREAIKKSQQQQKKGYDRTAREPEVSVGDRVLIYMPAAKQTPSYKFAIPYHGPYRVVEKRTNTIRAHQWEGPMSVPSMCH